MPIWKSIIEFLKSRIVKEKEEEEYVPPYLDRGV